MGESVEGHVFSGIRDLAAMAGNCLHILLPVDFSNSGLVQNFSEQLPKYLGEVSHDEHSGRIASVVVERHGETVLLVDDEATVRMLIADVLPLTEN